jgi:multisubunit Na+/H+ antiporter MnhE subunit
MQNKIKLPWLFIKLLIDIIICSFIVAYKIISMKKINSYITSIKSDKSQMTTSFMANAITLTPGTIAIDADQDQIEIHHFD